MLYTCFVVWFSYPVAQVVVRLALGEITGILLSRTLG